MSRYVDIDKPVIVTIYNDPFDDKKSERIATTIAELLRDTVDVLEEDIVRCKECKHTAHNVWGCLFGVPGGIKFFCGYGDREVTG